MIEVEVDFTEDEVTRLEERAKLMGIPFDELVRQSATSMLATPAPDEQKDRKTEG